MVAMVPFGSRLQVASDLHLERRSGVRISDLLRYNGATALLLAGDVGPVALTAKVFERWPVPVICVLGNHEYAMSKKLQTMPPAGETWLNRNVLLLENGIVCDGRNRIAGCCLWTDFNLLGQQAHAMALARGEIRDPVGTWRALPPLPDTTLAWHQRSVTWLMDFLSETSDGKTIVMSHHAPHQRSLVRNRYHNNFDAAFGSNLTVLLKMCDVWIHGHVHHSRDYQIGRCRVVCNPLGGLGMPNSFFKPSLSIVIA